MSKGSLSLLLVLSGILLALAGWAVYDAAYPSTTLATVPSLVPAGDMEMAWIHPATLGPTWQRFVGGLRHYQELRPELKMEIDTSAAFPEESSAVPSVRIRMGGQDRSLWLRWYKLTGQRSIHAWLEALLARQPPPVAVIGGGSSDRAAELAFALGKLSGADANGPLFCITTATSDRVATESGDTVDLMEIVPGRTFRFCFTNRQMVMAECDYLWNTPALRPDPGPVYLMSWRDDPYSEDLAERFREYLHAGPPIAPGQARSESSPVPFFHLSIPFSIGPLTEPNGREAEAIEKMLDDLRRRPQQRNTLLVLPGGATPSRRVLRAIFRAAPTEGMRLIATAGDAIDFNTIYRDRRLTWPIQDLPCRLLLFCHRNPVDAGAGFETGQGPVLGDTAGHTGTEDLLLYGELGTALAEAAFRPRWASGPREIAERLHTLRDRDGQLKFGKEGNRRGGSGEFLVLLEPRREADRVLPLATLTVVERTATGGGSWVMHRTLEVSYRQEANLAERKRP